MKRPHFTFAFVNPAGRHCNPLGLLLAGLLVVALHRVGTSLVAALLT